MEAPDAFWAEIATEYVDWFKKWDKVEDYNFDVQKGPIYVKYFEGGKLNVSYNCLDRQLKTGGTRSPSSGKAMNPLRINPTPTTSCIRKFASSPMS